MIGKLILLFIIVPLVELALLLALREATTSQFTLLLVIVTGILGAWLARWQGLGVLTRIQQQLARGQLPTDALLDGLMIFVAGALLLTPGILTDALGISLLVPVCRRFYKSWLAKRFRHHFTVHTVRPPDTAGGDRIIDSYVVEDEKDEEGGRT